MRKFYSLSEEKTINPYPVSAGEKARLDALKSYNILDTLEEEELNSITKMAALICDVPVALISLVDEERQWFKSKHGLNVPETERCISFCQYTIEEDSLFEVPNALLDRRFFNNPLVTGEPHIRFYCGAPLVNIDGHRLGSLCVIDNKPKTLTTQQKQALSVLAHNVVTHMELKRQRELLSQEKEQALQSENKYRNLVENNQGFICSHDMNGIILSVNQAACQALQYSRQELIGQNIEKILAPASRVLFATYLDTARKEDAFSGIMHVKSKDGSEQYWKYKNNKLYAADHTPYIIGSSLDVTDSHKSKQSLKEYNQELEQEVQQRTAQLAHSNQMLKETNQELDTFLYRASHDLKGPLASFMGLCNLASMEFTDSKVLEYFQMMGKKAIQTNDLITNLIEVSEIKKTPAALDRVNLHQVLTETTAQINSKKDLSNQIQIHISVEPDALIHSHATSVQLICKHIVENAIQYRNTAVADSYLTITAKPNAAGDTVIVFEDNGVGIPDQFHSKVFDMFCRADERSKGSGLGLYLVKKAVEQLDGSIALYSKPDQGTTLEITLPGKIALPETKPYEILHAGAKINSLLNDMNLTNQTLKSQINKIKSDMVSLDSFMQEYRTLTDSETKPVTEEKSPALPGTAGIKKGQSFDYTTFKQEAVKISDERKFVRKEKTLCKTAQ